VTAFIRTPVEKSSGTSAAERVAADAMGNIYGAEVGPTRLMRDLLLHGVTDFWNGWRHRHWCTQGVTASLPSQRELRPTVAEKFRGIQLTTARRHLQW